MSTAAAAVVAVGTITVAICAWVLPLQLQEKLVLATCPNVKNDLHLHIWDGGLHITARRRPWLRLRLRSVPLYARVKLHKAFAKVLAPSLGCAGSQVSRSFACTAIRCMRMGL